MKTTTLLVFAAASAAAIHSTNAQIIINGGFETPDTATYTLISAGQNTIAPWVVGGHSVDVADADDNGFIFGPAFEGAQQLDLNGLGRGRLTQAFATTPGVLYTVTFAYSNVYYNSSTPASAAVRLFDGLEDRLNQTITHTGAGPGDYHWTVFNGQFTAVQNTTSLEFTSLTDTNGYSGGIILDAVQVIEDIHSSLAGEITIVSPSAYKDTEGEEGTPENCCAPYRFQQVFPAEDFAALGNKPHWLVEITLRPDHSVTSPLTAHDPDCEIRLTTMPLGPPNLSLQFEDNLGSDFKQWYRGPQTQVADVVGPGPGPREFYQADRPAGVTPYLYDPSQGNLLFDFISYQGSPSNRNDGTPSVQTALAGSPFATQGGQYTAGIFQFTFIPVPAPSVVSIDLMPTGVRLRFAGVPGLGYAIERTAALSDPWSIINTQTAPASGLLEYVDILPHAGSGFYRIVLP